MTNRPASPAVPRVAKQLGLVSLLNDLASEMVYPLLPALFTLRLGAGAVALGTLDGVAEAVSAGVKLVSGWLADRPGLRRPLVVGGYLLAAVSRPLMGVAGAAWQVVTFRASDRVGKGLRTPPRDAIIADAADPAIRGRSFALHRALDHTGAVAGPLIAWALLERGAAPQHVIVGSVVPGVLAALLVVWATRGVRRMGPAPAAPGPTATPAPSSSRALFALIVSFAFLRMPETLFLLRLQDLGVAVAYVPLAWAALHVVRSAASYSGGWVSDRWGQRRTMLVGWIVYAAVSAGLAASATRAVALGWFLVFGLVAAFTESPERAFVAAAAPASERGRGYGRYHAAVGLAALPGSVILGVVYAQLGGPTVLYASGLGAVLLVMVGTSLRGR